MEGRGSGRRPPPPRELTRSEYRMMSWTERKRLRELVKRFPELEPSLAFSLENLDKEDEDLEDEDRSWLAKLNMAAGGYSCIASSSSCGQEDAFTFNSGTLFAASGPETISPKDLD